MSTRPESSRVRAPTPAAPLVLALLLAMGSAWPHVADGVRTTTPHASAGPADGSGVLGEAAPAAASSGRRTDKPADRTAASPEEEEEEGPVAVEDEEGELWAKERAATGSRLPDCAHACGPCSPCRRVMVSFMCAQASESCPVAYRCMCRGRFFRVPSL
ncbi:hypothetical protein BAE44_0012115 [Dichanthelium oligosanthes]|uniref:Epidermal patterning factor-like protein n=1 Tax=Dichanthelium oligosanthes TaxID=888268 RepID=A0A1E5VP47_9POAL|nr:hypothetical protein BAE44_0012115 [Dichanthelium oligosanthes]